MFKTVKNKKIFEVILDQIKELLLKKELVVGQKIPSEIELSESLGISRSSLREALRILDVLGIIEARAGEGTIVKQADPENLKNIMSLVALSRGIDTVELFEVRTVIEMYAARLAALHRSERDLAEIRHHLRRMDDKSLNDEEGIASDYYFHSAIVQASNNKILIMVMELIAGLLEEQIRTTRKRLAAGILKRFQQQHWEIYSAIEGGKPEQAEAAVMEHMNYAQQELGFQPRYKGAMQ